MLQELEEDATLLLNLKEDVRNECKTVGEVTDVTLSDMSCCFFSGFHLSVQLCFVGLQKEEIGVIMVWRILPRRPALPFVLLFRFKSLSANSLSPHRE